MRAGYLNVRLTSILAFTLAVLFHPFLSHAESGGELVRLFDPFPAHFNSAVTDDLSITAAASNIFVSLLEIDDEGGFQPYLASEWDASGDGMVYTFRLAEETVFHDGQPVTSSDVAFSYRTFRQYHPLGERLFGRVESVETPDPGTFVIHLTKPDPALLFGLACPFMPILPEHIYGPAEILKNPANVKAVGSGPFRVVSFQAGETFTLERFEQFLRPERPLLDRIIGRDGSDIQSALSAINDGDAHLFTFVDTAKTAPVLSENDKFSVTSSGYENMGAMNYLEFNLRKKPLKNREVRQAIAHAMNLESINQTLFRDYAKPLNSPMSPASAFFKTGTVPYPTDIEKAKLLLDEAGYPLNKDGIRFETHLTWAPSEAHHQTAIHIQSQLKNIGIDVILDPPQSYIDWYIQIAKWQHHMTLSRVFSWEDPIINLHPLYSSKLIRHQVGTNTAGFHNEQADVLLEAAEAETDGDIRSGLYQQFQELVGEELPLFFMNSPPFLTIFNPDLLNIPLTGRQVIGPMDRISWNDN